MAIILAKILKLQGLFPPGQGATIGVDFMIKTVEVENEKVKVYSLYATYALGIYDLQSNAVFHFSCKSGILQARKDFVPLLKVIIDQHMH